MLAQLPICFLPQARPLRKIKRRYVCVWVSVCGDEDMEVCVSRDSVKGGE